MKVFNKIAICAAIALFWTSAASASDLSYVGTNPYIAPLAKSGVVQESIGARSSLLVGGQEMDFYETYGDRKSDAVAYASCFMIYCITDENADGWDWIWNVHG